MKIVIEKINNSVEDAVTLYFKKGEEPLRHKPGQHGNFIFTIGEITARRSYSFHTAPESDEPAITVRSVEGGLVSNNLLKQKIAQVEIESVTGDFFIEPSPDIKRHLIMFAGGSGITPILSMIQAILNGEPRSVISLVYTNRTLKTILFRKELNQLEQQFPGKLKIHHVLTREELIPADFPVFYKGRLPKLVIKKLVKALIAENNFCTEYYLCGPFDFITHVEEALRSIHSERINLFKEHFFIPAKESDFDFTSLPGHEVVLQTSGGDELVRTGSGRSILRSALEQGIPLPHSCTEGQCGVCRAILVQGEVKLRKNHILTESELAFGEILLCQGFPVSDGVVIKTRL